MCASTGPRTSQFATSSICVINVHPSWCAKMPRHGLTLLTIAGLRVRTGRVQGAVHVSYVDTDCSKRHVLDRVS